MTDRPGGQPGSPVAAPVPAPVPVPPLAPSAERTACPVCDSPRLRAMPRYRTAHLTACATCGHVFARLIPSQAELEQHYGRSGKYSRADCESSITLSRYASLLDGFEPQRRTNRLLDVGCGVGDFARVALDRGWEAHGVEFDATARAICESKGVPTTQGPLDPSDHPPGSFDVITLFEVLEHLVDPAQEMRNVAGLLRPGGHLYLTTPNFASLSRRILGPRWRVVQYPEHLGYFKPATIDELLGRSGLAKVRLGSTGISPGKLRAALRRPRSAPPPPSRQIDERVRAALERPGLETAKRAVNGVLSVTGAGDTLKARYARA